jgi:hypothetical protein
MRENYGFIQRRESIPEVGKTVACPHEMLQAEEQTFMCFMHNA